MLPRRRRPPPIKLRLAAAPPLPRSQRIEQPPDVLSRTNTSSSWKKRLLRYYGFIKPEFRDLYVEMMDQQFLQAQRLHSLLTAGDDVEHLVKAELRRYKIYYTVSMRPTKPTHIIQITVPDWKPLLETAFMWMGEWRPSAMLAFLLTCHETNAIILPPHHVGFVRELGRISQANETILDEELAELQALSALDDASAMPELVFMFYNGGTYSSVKNHVKAELVRCMRNNLMRMNGIVEKAQHLRWEVVQIVVRQILTVTQAAHFFLIFARFQYMFHGVALGG